MDDLYPYWEDADDEYMPDWYDEAEDDIDYDEPICPHCGSQDVDEISDGRYFCNDCHHRFVR